MGHAFEQEDTFEVPASPEEVWEAIATGPGIGTWFLGRSEVEGGLGGVVRMECGEYEPRSRITAWEPGRRFAHHSGEAPDGRFIAYEFLIEGRDRSSTVLRMVTSGFLPGDDWGDEYDAMLKGGALYSATLVAHLTHFAGRTAAPITVFGPKLSDWDRAWSALHKELGLGEPASVGDPVHFAPADLPVVDGVVYHVNEHTLGVRADDAIYRFIKGFGGSMMLGHALFAPDADTDHAARAWGAWLARVPARPL